MKRLERAGSAVEVDPKAWVQMVQYLLTHGWTSGVSSQHWFAKEYVVTEAMARGLADAGNLVLAELLQDPLSASDRLGFDVGKFFEVAEFASQGEFIIRDKK